MVSLTFRGGFPSFVMVRNLYPDPDFVPSFPWLGQLENEDGNDNDETFAVDVESPKNEISSASPQDGLPSDMDYQSSDLSST